MSVCKPFLCKLELKKKTNSFKFKERFKTYVDLKFNTKQILKLMTCSLSNS